VALAGRENFPLVLPRNNTMTIRSLLFLVSCVLLFCFAPACAGQVPVRYQEGITHGFLTLRTLDGRLIAEGEIAQTAKDGVVTSQLTFHFKDGSFYQDTTTFGQRGNFRLLKDHVVQKGPAFKQQMESTVDAEHGKVNVHFEEDGKPKELEQSMELPADLSNGLLFTIVKNFLPNPVTTVSYLAFTPKPALVKLVFTKQEREKLKVGSMRQPGIHFVMKVKIGGLKGAMASLLKKKPPDTQMWILDEQVPTLVASEGPLYGDGPVWRIELMSPERARQTAEEPR
jgi:hypothetical protein